MTVFRLKSYRCESEVFDVLPAKRKGPLPKVEPQAFSTLCILLVLSAMVLLLLAYRVTSGGGSVTSKGSSVASKGSSVASKRIRYKRSAFRFKHCDVGFVVLNQQ